MNIFGVTISVERDPAIQRKWSKRAVAITVASATLVAGGVAYAAWTVAGTAAGTAKAGTLQAAVVAAGTAPVGQLYPGLTANGSTTGGDLVVSASNPNPVAVVVTITGGTFAGTGCTTSGVSIGSPATFNLAANAATAQVTIPKVLSMSTASTNNCQGVQIDATSLTSSTATP